MTNLINTAKDFSTKTLVAVLIVSMFGFGFSYNQAKAQTTTVYQPQNTLEYLAFLYGQLLQLQIQLQALQKLETGQTTGSDTRSNRRYSNPNFMTVTTIAPSAVGRTTAELQAKTDPGSSDEAWLWFEYGVGNNLNKKSDDVKLSSNRYYSYRNTVGDKIIVTDLKPNTKYSYRAIMEDQDGYLVVGEVRSFETVAKALTQSFYGLPKAETEGVTKVLSTSAEIRGFISMNDHTEGTGFVIYGTDYSDVNDVEDDYETFAEIKATRDGLNKLSSRDELVERNTVTFSIRSLSRATKYYYSVCVEYEEDRGNDLRITCSGVESFVTAN
ncbi:MAG: hypothetical protein R3B60_05135 [Candidatus Paceibacterota bacterium]